MPRKDTVAKRVRMALAQMDPHVEDREVARRANLPVKWLTAVKHGHIKNPPVDKLVALARACGVEPYFLTEPLEVVPVLVPSQAEIARTKAAVLGLPWPEEYKRGVIAKIDEEADRLYRASDATSNFSQVEQRRRDTVT